MTRNLVGLTTAFALAATLALDVNRASAQQSGTATSDAAISTDHAPSTPTQGNAGEQAAGEAQKGSERQNANYGSSSAQSNTQLSTGTANTQQAAGQTSQNTATPNQGLPQQDASSTQNRSIPGNVQDQSGRTQSNWDSQSNRLDGNARSQTSANAQDRIGRLNDWQRGVQFGRSSDRGLTVTNIERNNFFFNSGIRPNDVIVSVDGRPIRSDADFFASVSVRPGARVPVLVFRDGRQETIFIQSPQAVAQSQQDYNTQQFQPGDRPYLGVAFDSRVRSAAIIAAVVPGGPAEQAGLQSGDEIVAINGEPVRSHQDAVAIVGSMRPGDQLAVVFGRRMENQTDVVLGGQPGSSVRTTYKPVIPSDGESVLIESEQYGADDYQRNRDWNRETEVNDRDTGEDSGGALNRNRGDYDPSDQPLRRRLLGR
jgi:hypothetical protein